MGFNMFLNSTTTTTSTSAFMPVEPDIFIIPPSAIPQMVATGVDVEIFGSALNDDEQVRLVIQQQSAIILERILSPVEIVSGKVHLSLPQIPEGLVSFLLIAKRHEIPTILQTVPCCVVPPLIVQDIERMFLIMCSEAAKLTDLPDYVTDEQTRMVWVWKEHFLQFLEDIEVLFEWTEKTENYESTLMVILTNMLQQCCMYEAWDFTAYVINKAIERGVQIKPNPFSETNKITAESLKAVVYSQRDVCSKESLFEEMKRRP
eukprot:g5526.t1